MEDKIKEVREFILANPDKSNNWYATHNGVVSRRTFYEYLKYGVVQTPVQTPVQTAVQTAMDRSMQDYIELKNKYEELQVDYIQMKQLKERYENIIHNSPYQQRDFEELQKKYERLQVDYLTLKNEMDERGNKVEEKPVTQPKEHHWYDD